MELSFSMPPCCFPAVLLVQGIIARMQSGTAVQSQHGPVQCLNCWSGNLGQRHLKGSAKVNCGLPALLVTPDMNSGSLLSHPCSIILYISGILICGQLMINSFLKQGWDLGILIN